MILWEKLKKKLKAGIHIPLFGYQMHLNISKSRDKHQVNSPTQLDTFENDFQFNMFVEHALDVSVKRTIISQIFYRTIGYYPNIDEPKTFSEKVLWLKLYYEDPLIEKACDKALGKEYIDSVLGPGYTVPIIKIFDSVHDINLDELPDRFVFKVNWATGCNIIVKNKDRINIEKTRAILDRWTLPWKCSYYGSFNVGYRNVKPIIFAEEYLDISNNSTEFKVFCFNGRAEFVLLELDYFGKQPRRAYYDRDWNEVPWRFGKIQTASVPEKPAEYDEIIRLAEKVAEPFPYIRVDFYDIEGKLYIGELTFYSGGGFSYLNPPEYDKLLGDKLDISIAMGKMGWDPIQKIITEKGGE